MEYADGLPLADVGWGQLTTRRHQPDLSLYNLVLDLDTAHPTWRASEFHVSFPCGPVPVQASTGKCDDRRVGQSDHQIIVFDGFETNIAGLAGLFHLDWLFRVTKRDVCVRAAPWFSTPPIAEHWRNTSFERSYVAQDYGPAFAIKTALTLPSAHPGAIRWGVHRWLPVSATSDIHDCPRSEFHGGWQWT